jgi:hypothetical protein
MKILNCAVLVVCGFLSLIIAKAPADAATVTFDWTLTSGSSAANGGFHFTGAGTITATSGTGGYAITGITGTISDGSTPETITRLATAGDDLLFPIGTTFTGPPIVNSGSSYISTSNLDTTGFGFRTVAGTIDIFGFNNPNSTDVVAGSNNYGETSPDGFGVGIFALTATPLPATLPLFAGGLGFVGFLTRRKKGQCVGSRVS